MDWRLADAKNRFSELVTRALAEGPQRVRRHNDAVVVVAERDYEKLTGKRPDFKEFLLRGHLRRINPVRVHARCRWLGMAKYALDHRKVDFIGMVIHVRQGKGGRDRDVLL